MINTDITRSDKKSDEYKEGFDRAISIVEGEIRVAVTINEQMAAGMLQVLSLLNAERRDVSND